MPVNYDQFRGNFRSVVVITETVPGIAGPRLRERAEIFSFVHPRSQEGREGAPVIYIATL